MCTLLDKFLYNVRIFKNTAIVNCFITIVTNYISTFYQRQKEIFHNFYTCRFSRSLSGRDMLVGQLCLDRRCLEEAFLLYAVLKVHFEYDMGIEHVDFDRNFLVEGVYCNLDW